MKKKSHCDYRYRAVVMLLVLSLMAGGILLYYILKSLPSHHGVPF